MKKKKVRWFYYDIARGVMNTFCYTFGCKIDQIKLRPPNPHIAKIEDIIPENEIWEKSLRIHFSVFRKYEKEGMSGDYTKTKLWKHNVANLPPNSKNTDKVKAHFARLFWLFDSIKERGYEKRPNNFVKLILIEDLKKKSDNWGGRISKRYYRINGRKRVTICKYLGIDKIPTQLYKVKIRTR